MSLESPCAPRVSRTLSEMLQLISKAAVRPGHTGVRQAATAAKQRQGGRNAARWGEVGSVCCSGHAHLHAHTHPWLLQVVVQRETWPALCVGFGNWVHSPCSVLVWAVTPTLGSYGIWQIFLAGGGCGLIIPPWRGDLEHSGNPKRGHALPSSGLAKWGDPGRPLSREKGWESFPERAQWLLS